MDHCDETILRFALRLKDLLVVRRVGRISDHGVDPDLQPAARTFSHQVAIDGAADPVDENVGSGEFSGNGFFLSRRLKGVHSVGIGIVQSGVIYDIVDQRHFDPDFHRVFPHVTGGAADLQPRFIDGE